MFSFLLLQIEREVILSSTDKNNKIPILHDYMKRSKGAIAPDVPPKQMAAWTQGQGSQPGQQILSPDQVFFETDIYVNENKNFSDFETDYSSKDCLNDMNYVTFVFKHEYPCFIFRPDYFLNHHIPHRTLC